MLLPWTYEELLDKILSGEIKPSDMDDEIFDEAMRLSNPKGRTIAHDAVGMNFFGDERRHLLFLADDEGWSVAHSAVKISYDGDEPFAGVFAQTADVARLSTKTGRVSVAHRLAKAGILTENLRASEEIMSMECLGGETVRFFVERAELMMSSPSAR